MKFYCILLFLGVSLLLNAEEINVELEDMVISPTASSKAISETPYNVTLLSADEYHLTLQPKSFPDALLEIPGVMIQKTGHGMSSPYLRGVTGQRIVLIADGIRLNNSFLREGPNQYWNTIDPFFYDNAEVLMGPSSVLYGSDAIGGVVSAYSTPLERGIAGEKWQSHGGNIILRYSSAESSFSEHINYEMAFSDKLSLKLGLTKQDFGELRTGNNTENPNTDYRQWGGNFRGQYWLDADNSIVFGYDHFDQDDINRVHKTVDHVDFQGTSTKGSTSNIRRIYDHDRRSIFARYEKRNGNTFIEEMDLGVYYQFMKENYSRLRDNGQDWDYYKTIIETIGLNLRFKTLSDFGAWTYGFDFSTDMAKASHDRIFPNPASNRIYDQGVIADNAIYDSYGVYLQNEKDLSKKLQIISGARYSWMRMRARDTNLDSDRNGITDDLKGNWDALTLSSRLIYKLMDKNKLNVFTGISQGFRAPNLSDATRDDEWGGGTEKPTADLDAEKFTTYEIGFKCKGDIGAWNLTGFYTQIKDRIERLASPTATKRNLDDGYIQGFETNASLYLSKELTLSGSLSFQEGREDNYYNRDSTQPGETLTLPRMMPLTSRLGLKYRPDSEKYWLEFYVNIAKKQDHLTDGEKSDNRYPPGGTPGYIVYNVRGNYSFTPLVTLSVALENLTDKDYRMHGSGINEPGFNVVSTLRVKF